MNAHAMHRTGHALLLVAALLLSGTAVWAEEMTPSPTLRIPAQALARLRLIPVQHAGRHKPFDSFAREFLTHVTGAPRIGREDPIVTVLSMIAFPEAWQSRPIISVPFHPLREALGMNPKATHIAQEEIVTTRTLMKKLPAIVEKQRRDDKLTMLEQETMDAFDRFAAFTGLIEHRLEIVPLGEGASNRVWSSVQQPVGSPDQQASVRANWGAFVHALRAGEPEEITAATQTLSEGLAVLGRGDPFYPARWRLRLEVFYHWVGPFRIARILYVLAAVGLLLGLFAARRGAAAIGLMAFWWAMIVHVTGIAMRVVIGGRPPVSNFFETMLWLPLVGVVLALVFERLYRAGYFALSASILAAITLWLSDVVPLDSSISPVVAVLRSNLWLTIHVLTIVASYGALALATVLAHIYGVQFLAGQGKKVLAPLDTFLYRTIQVGVVLLAGGIMLGAVWANASWGRYWGWDPKETWALITLLWFVAVLHGRLIGWLKGVSVALATIGGFFLLLMTYYGVSFYLVGLHSYAGGHAKPLPPLLIAYLLAEAAFLGWLAWAASSRSRRLAS